MDFGVGLKILLKVAKTKMSLKHTKSGDIMVNRSELYGPQ